MTSNPNELNQAVVLCIGYGSALSPKCDEQKLIDVFGPQVGIALFAEVQRLADEASQMPIDWGSSSLEAAGERVHAEMHSRYPNLDNQALDAIVWKFTFDWR